MLISALTIKNSAKKFHEFRFIEILVPRSPLFEVLEEDCDAQQITIAETSHMYCDDIKAHLFKR
ncbi:hypothetical protein DICVIV_08387 [Dictyocaulus viviparus]|uniref:Uncharacterized protein n=1 Tax=Dictyocaulus viviparus TaxID=29172 RepID=A0A0D8XLY2_DICVI|nr:hypothetical protein DICVIV_08387 [Dictyocaulus viviparus]